MRIDVHHYLHDDEENKSLLTKILAVSQDTNRRIKSMGQELDALNANMDTLATEVNDIGTVEASVEATLTALVSKQADLQAQLQAAIDAGNPAAIQTAADNLAAQNQALDAVKTKLAAAIANVPTA